MKRRNAILAAVIGVVIVAAAAGGIILMNPGTQTTSTGKDGAGAQDGAVTATEINSAAINASIASSFAELAAELNATSDSSGPPDFVMKVAVTNNMESNLTLNGSGFSAMLANGSSTQAIGNMSMIIEPNTTVFPVIGFQTNGMNVQSVNYSDDSVSFSVNRTFQDISVPGMVLSSGPEGNTTEVKNLTFQNLAAWRIDRGGFAPMPLAFNESGNVSVVLALMTVRNTNTTDFNMSASQFWLDIGNGTWAQGDMVANNIPRVVENNTTVPFLVGFRIPDNATNIGSIYFWPNQSQFLAQIPISMSDGLNATPTLALKAVRELTNKTDGNATAGGDMMNETANSTNAGNEAGNATDNKSTNASMTTWVIELVAVGENGTVADVTEVTIWTLRNGSMNVSPQASEDDRSLNVTVNLEQGDEVTLLSFNVGGETKYVWMRPLAPQT